MGDEQEFALRGAAALAVVGERARRDRARRRPGLLLPTSYAVFAALPLAVIAAYVGWQQLRAPSAKRVAGTLERLRAMSWEDFSAAIEEAYRREGYTVSRHAGHADFELVQGSRSTLVACKRWKATRTGIEPLRELEVIRRT